MELIHESVVYSESRKGVARKRLVGRVRIWYTATVSANLRYTLPKFFPQIISPFKIYPFKIYPFVVRSIQRVIQPSVTQQLSKFPSKKGIVANLWNLQDKRANKKLSRN